MSIAVNSFIPSKDIVLEAPIENEELLLTLDIENVDRVGFDLTTLEQEYYKVNNLELTTKVLLSKDSKKDSWDTIFQKWFFTSKLADNIYIDHSGLYGVYPFVGKAADQLRKFIPKRPELAKLLNLRGKVGYDICVDYINGETVIELLHLEHDYGLEDYTDFLINKASIQVEVVQLNWESYLEKLQAKVEDVTNPRNHDLKSNFFGFSKAFSYYNRL